MKLKLKTKNIRLAILLSFVLLISIFLFRGPLRLEFYKIIYEDEIQLGRNCISLLAVGAENEIRDISFGEPYFLKSSSYMVEFSKYLNQFDVDDFKILNISCVKENKYEVLFVNFYQENHQYLEVRLKFIRHSNKWLLASAMLSH